MVRSKAGIAERYEAVRNHSLEMVKCLEGDEEFYNQSVQEISPASWNLGHSTWFFDAIILSTYSHTIGGKDSDLWYHFNSYYKGAGKHVRQACRGTILITEVSLESIYKYRQDVDAIVHQLLLKDRGPEFDALVELGINHEQQHQELFYVEVLRNRFESNTTTPFLDLPEYPLTSTPVPVDWVSFAPALTEIGNVEGEFGFDNEYAIHKVYVNPFCLMNRPVTNSEYLEFIDDGGYENYEYWLAESWDDASMSPILRYPDRIENPLAPLYWRHNKGEWSRFALSGWQPLDPNQPVSHVSYYEAVAFSKWKSKREAQIFRLPTEAEWERAARESNAMCQVEYRKAVLLDSRTYNSAMTVQDSRLMHMIGNVWEWTNSAYLQHPGFQPYDGTIQEYNGKFMSNKMVLKGGSWATPDDHIRISYRNFWPLSFRFANPGFRLAMES
jgi:ergothioneine biosynthesis protein EgtB